MEEEYGAEEMRYAHLYEENDRLKQDNKRLREEVRRLEKGMRGQYQTIEVLQDAIVNQAILFGMAMEWGGQQDEVE